MANGEAAFDYLAKGGEADAVLLDWRMPGMDGPGLLRRMREARIATPVIFLTMLGHEIYEEAALKWGAVDFIDKSRRLSIILERLRIITEGTKPTGPSADVVCVDRLELKEDVKRAYWDGKQVDLTLSEYSVVRMLAEQPGNDISYRQIYDIVRGKDFVAGHGTEGYRVNVRSCIKRIRKKFLEIDPNFDQIGNYPGFGYRWLDHRGNEGSITP